MKRLIAATAALILLSPSALGAQAPPALSQEIAIVLRVPMWTRFVDLSGSVTVRAGELDALARSLERWSMPPLEEAPLSLAVSPALCDALQLADLPSARRTLNALRRLAKRAHVLTVPYADVWLPYLENAKAVEEQLDEGSAALRRCFGRPSTDVAFGHVLHTGESEPTQDLDEESVVGVTRAGIDTIVAHGITQTPVRTEDVVVVPFTSIASLVLDADGTIREPTSLGTFALVTNAREPEELVLIERLLEGQSVSLVGLDEIGQDVPRVAVAFPDDPMVADRYRERIDAARAAIETLVAVTLDDNPIHPRLKVLYAHALGRASKDAEAALELGERRPPTSSADEISRFVRRELERVTLTEGTVTFTSRRGSVPVTIANRAAYPVRVRVSVSSPKLTFPNGRTRVVTIEPPGDTITFEAIARSTGTFPTVAVLKSPDGKATLDRTELTVRSTATNLSALILTGGGAVFLIVFLGRRVGRRRATSDLRKDAGS